MIMSNRLAGVLVLLILLFASGKGCVQDENEPANMFLDLQLQTIDVDGVQRNYYSHFPSSHKSSPKTPLVLVLHGGGRGDGLTPAKYLGFTSVADSEGFIVVYPNGIDAYWRDGRGYTHRGESDDSVDDVGFISKLIDHLVRVNKADPKRVYVTGISNGGMMTLRLGCELSSKLAAIAPIAANIPENIVASCRPDLPLPVLLMNGTDDPMVPYDGGHVHFFRRKMGEVVSTSETVSFWVKHNRCNAVPDVNELPDRDLRDHSQVQVATYSNPSNGCEVVLYTIKGGGHTLPGSDTPDIPRILGRKNNDIDGAEVIWGFFKRHSR
jgi:polyhydroxybutyrate depolymerase